MAASEILALAASLPAIAVAAAHVLAALGFPAAPPSAAALLSSDATVGSALLFGLAFALYLSVSLRRIARDVAVVRSSARSTSDAGDAGAAVVDFAIHLDRRREIALTAADEVLPPPDVSRTTRSLAAHPALSEMKSRLSDIPSVRRGDRG